MRYLIPFIASFLSLAIACNSQTSFENSSSVAELTPTSSPTSIDTKNINPLPTPTISTTMNSPTTPIASKATNLTNSIWQDFNNGWLVEKELSQVEYETDPIWEILIQLMIEKELSEKLNSPSIPDQLIQEYAEKVEVGLRQGYDFVIKIPPSYSESSRNYPLVLFLHGGIDGSISNVQGRIKDFFQQQEEPYIVIAPVKNEIDWNPKKIEDIIIMAQENLRIDQNRIYLTGLSMGGRGTYIVASHLENTFAAIMPLSSHHAPYSYVDLAPELNNIPIWIFHGDTDMVSSYAMAVEMVSALGKYNSKIRFTSIQGGGHGNWKEIYNTPEHIQWLLSHSRN
ncbi:MAG: hypothetical protein CL792_05765 [Chloroflexi bacterium]|mgnify:CR=1 FL=1|nr:hypothetical protein [Chloroflexota bacterium]